VLNRVLPAAALSRAWLLVHAVLFLMCVLVAEVAGHPMWIYSPMVGGASWKLDGMGSNLTRLLLFLFFRISP
jgi:hypothetical protein